MERKDNFKPRQPFKKDLEPADVDLRRTYRPSYFVELSDVPKKIFRKIDTLHGTEKLSEKVTEIKKVFDVLADCGVNIPRMDFFVTEGEKQGFPELKVMVEKIEGVNFEDMIESAKSKKRTSLVETLVESLFLQLIEYLIRVDKEKSSFLIDIFTPHQYMYGKTSRDVEDKLYLIDIEPHYRSVDTEEEPRQEALSVTVRSFGDKIVFLERHLQVRFFGIRRKLSIGDPNNLCIKILRSKLGI